MSAGITDLLDRVSDSNIGRPVISSLGGSGKGLGASSISITDTTNWTTSSAIHFSIYKVTSNGYKDPTTQTDWKGVLAGTTISSLTLTGGADRAYTSGDIVELTPTARYAKDIYDWATTDHNADGTHKAFTESNIVPTSAIQDSAVTTSKVADAAISTVKLADGAITNAKLNTASGELGGAWKSYVPTWTNLTVGNGTVTASYTQIGKTVIIKVALIWGSTTSASGFIAVSLPVTASPLIGTGQEIGMTKANNGTYSFQGPFTQSGTASGLLRWYQLQGSGQIETNVTNTSPSAWSAGNEFMVHAMYEAA